MDGLSDLDWTRFGKSPPQQNRSGCFVPSFLTTSHLSARDVIRDVTVVTEQVTLFLQVFQGLGL